MNKCKSSPDLIGLYPFKKFLEKFFFAKTNILSNYTKEISCCKLIIDLKCNFNLSDYLYHFNNDNCIELNNKYNTIEYSCFEKVFYDFQQKNANNLIIEEFVIHFKDTSLFISRTADLEIANQLLSILSALSENFIYFTNGISEVPYEIYIPIFEEKTNTNPLHPISKVSQGYLNYWELYFHSRQNHDSFVYDLKNKTIINGDLSLVNMD